MGRCDFTGGVVDDEFEIVVPRGLAITGGPGLVEIVVRISVAFIHDIAFICDAMR